MYDTLMNIRYLIMFAIIDGFMCIEMENACGFQESDFMKVCSDLYEASFNINSECLPSIKEFINNKSLFIARSCIIHAEGSFGIYSKNVDKYNDIYNKYKDCLEILNEIVVDDV